MPTVLILGATSDIGIAIAKSFAARKYDVQLAARNPAQLTAAKSDIEIRYHVSCQVYAFNATAYAQHQDFFNQLLPKPEVCVCVFGYLGENETARKDWSQASDII